AYRQVRLADTRRPEEQDVVGVGDEPAGGEFLDHLRVYGRLKLQVEALQAFVEREPRHGGLHHGMALLLGGDLHFEKFLEDIAVGQVLLAGGLKQGSDLLGGSDELEPLHLLGEPFDLGSGAHWATSWYQLSGLISTSPRLST